MKDLTIDSSTHGGTCVCYTYDETQTILGFVFVGKKNAARQRKLIVSVAFDFMLFDVKGLQCHLPPSLVP